MPSFGDALPPALLVVAEVVEVDVAGCFDDVVDVPVRCRLDIVPGDEETPLLADAIPELVD